MVEGRRSVEEGNSSRQVSAPRGKTRVEANHRNVLRRVANLQQAVEAP